jgi:hypothetical protein
MNILDDTFPTIYHAPQTKIVCQSYTPGKLIHQTTQNGVHKTVGFSSSAVSVLDFFFMLKRPLEPHCNNHLLVNVSSRHISSQRYAATILASLSLCISTVLYISLINRNCVLLYLYVYDCISDIYFCYIIVYLIYLCTFLYCISTLISC